jgi:hypothetical protein
LARQRHLIEFWLNLPQNSQPAQIAEVPTSRLKSVSEDAEECLFSAERPTIAWIVTIPLTGSRINRDVQLRRDLEWAIKG